MTKRQVRKNILVVFDELLVKIKKNKTRGETPGQPLLLGPMHPLSFLKPGAYAGDEKASKNI